MPNLHLSPALRRLFATTEGVLLILFNAAMLLVPIITGALSAGTAAKYAGLLDMVALVARQGAKAIVSLAGLIGVKPANLNAGSLIETILSDRTLLQKLIAAIDNQRPPAPATAGMARDRAEGTGGPGQTVAEGVIFPRPMDGPMLAPEAERPAQTATDHPLAAEAGQAGPDASQDAPPPPGAQP